MTRTMNTSNYKTWLKKSAWLKGLVWGWVMFLILTGIDYHNNGALETGKVLMRFGAWSIGGILFWYLRIYMLRNL